MTELLSYLMNDICQLLMLPCLILLYLLALISVLSIGAVIAEFFVEKRYRHLDGTALIFDLHKGGHKQLLGIIEASELLPRHKRRILTLINAGELTEQELFILAEKQIADEENARRKSLEIIGLVVRLGPMAGLLGTLIPLGPGIIALGQGDAATLSQSLQTAFNTTIIGVASAGIAYVLSQIRRRWYREESILLESLIGCCLEELKHEK